MTRIAVLQRRAAPPDGVLVQEAAAGGGTSFAALYDRYETPVFNYCLRLTDSADDAADATQEAFLSVLRRLQTDDSPVLDFKAYLFTAARNECYRLTGRRARSTPSEEPPEPMERTAGPGDIEVDPERSLLLRDSQEQVRSANSRLLPRQREVLALRELGDLSYEEIGAVLGISANAAAQLLFRARSNLREELHEGAVHSVAATSEDCERAQLLLGMRQDGELVEEEDREWLERHLDECDYCRASRAMLAEVATSYRAWLPVAAIVGLRDHTFAQAGELVGADWSGVAAHGAKAHPHAAQAAVGAGTVVAVGAVALTMAALLKNEPEKAPPAAAPPAAQSAPVKASAKRVKHERARSHAPRSHPAAAARRPRTGPPPRGGAAPAAEVREAPASPEAPPTEPPASGPAPAPRAAPRPPPAPAPVAPTPVEAPPLPAAPPPAAGCSHPGGGTGLDACPPGQGGTPPGQGGLVPGTGKPPGGPPRGQGRGRSKGPA